MHTRACSARIGKQLQRYSALHNYAIDGGRRRRDTNGGGGQTFATGIGGNPKMGTVHYDDNGALKLVVGVRTSITATMCARACRWRKSAITCVYCKTPMCVRCTCTIQWTLKRTTRRINFRATIRIVGTNCCHTVCASMWVSITGSDAVNEAHSPMNDAHAHGTLYFDFFKRRYDFVQAHVSTNHNMCLHYGVTEEEH